MAERGIDLPGGERLHDSPGSGIARYERQVTTDGAGLSGYPTRTSPDGVTWSSPVVGASATAPAAPTAGSTVKIDRTNPTEPTVTGGSASWQTSAPVTVLAAGHGCGQRYPQV